MLALSLKQPFATLVVTRAKRWESRSWVPAHHERMTGWYLIHASSRHDAKLAEAFVKHSGTRQRLRRAGITGDTVYTTGAIVGAAYVDRFAPLTKEVVLKLAPADDALCLFPQSGWLWHIRDAVALDRPVPVNGKLNLWTPPASVCRTVAARLPADIAAAVISTRAS